MHCQSDETPSRGAATRVYWRQPFNANHVPNPIYGINSYLHQNTYCSSLVIRLEIKLLPRLPINVDRDKQLLEQRVCLQFPPTSHCYSNSAHQYWSFYSFDRAYLSAIILQTSNDFVSHIFNVKLLSPKLAPVLTAPCNITFHDDEPGQTKLISDKDNMKRTSENRNVIIFDGNTSVPKYSVW